MIDDADQPAPFGLKLLSGRGEFFLGLGQGVGAPFQYSNASTQTQVPPDAGLRWPVTSIRTVCVAGASPYFVKPRPAHSVALYSSTIPLATPSTANRPLPSASVNV